MLHIKLLLTGMLSCMRLKAWKVHSIRDPYPTIRNDLLVYRIQPQKAASGRQPGRKLDDNGTWMAYPHVSCRGL